MLYKLKRPCQWEGRIYTEIEVLLEPLAGQGPRLAAEACRRGEDPLAKAFDQEWIAEVCARQSGLPRAFFLALPASDFVDLCARAMVALAPEA